MGFGAQGEIRTHNALRQRLLRPPRLPKLRHQETINRLAPFTIDFEISKFEIVTNPILSGEEYRQLCKYLNLHYDKDNPFRPVNFLYEINKKSPLKYDRKAAVHQSSLCG